jgi:hypothetical protein
MNWKKILYCAIWILLVPAIACGVTFRISGGTVSYETGSITDDAISNSTKISADKLKHIYKASTDFDLGAAATPTAQTRTIFVASNAGTIRGFHVMLQDTGTSTSMTWDLKKNGTTVLTGTVSSTHSDTDGQVKDGTLSVTSFVAADRFTVVTTVSSSTGAQGPYAWADLEESAP